MAASRMGFPRSISPEPTVIGPTHSHDPDAAPGEFPVSFGTTHAPRTERDRQRGRTVPALLGQSPTTTFPRRDAAATFSPVQGKV